MIKTATELEQAGRQIGRLVDLINSLVVETHNNPTLLRTLLEGPVEQIRQLELEIDDYVAMITESQIRPDYWVEFRGDPFDEHRLSVGFANSFFSALRMALAQVAAFLETGQRAKRPRTFKPASLDFDLVSLRPGSVRLGITFSHSVDRVRPLLMQAADEVFEFSGLLSTEDPAAWRGALERYPNPDHRRVLIDAARALAYRGLKGVESVALDRADGKLGLDIRPAVLVNRLAEGGPLFPTGDATLPAEDAARLIADRPAAAARRSRQHPLADAERAVGVIEEIDLVKRHTRVMLLHSRERVELTFSPKLADVLRRKVGDLVSLRLSTTTIPSQLPSIVAVEETS